MDGTCLSARRMGKPPVSDIMPALALTVLIASLIRVIAVVRLWSRLW